MKALAVALGVIAGCADNTITVSPIIDVPANDSASAFPLDQLVLSVAEAGSSADLVSQTFAKGSQVSLPGVPFGNDLVIHMTGRVGSSEIAYGRTCAISITADAPAPQPHLFFAREVKFADLDLTLQPEARQDGIAITDVAGAGLILGGHTPGAMTPNGEIERFDPLTGELRLLASPPEVTPRSGAVAAQLGTGGDTRIALIGGADTNGNGATFIELVEPDAPSGRRVDRVDDAQMARTMLTATALTDGRVIAIGGLAAGTPSNAVDEVTIANGTATVRVLRAMLVHPRYAHTATRLGADVGAPVLVAGGLDGASPVPQPIATSELFKPLSEDISPTFKPDMIYARSAHQAVRMPDGSVLIIGGVGYFDPKGLIGPPDAIGPVPSLELFTLDAGFTDVGKLPTNAGLTGFAATPLPDGRVLLTGGRTADGTVTDTAFIARLDPIDGSVDVVATDHMSVPRAGHSATLLCDGTIFISGGTTDPAPAERYNPPALDRR
ncbi:MAG: hypothetical protein ABJE66_10940 [Deltaproteobacteria bacterium]